MLQSAFSTASRRCLRRSWRDSRQALSLIRGEDPRPQSSSFAASRHFVNISPNSAKQPWQSLAPKHEKLREKPQSTTEVNDDAAKIEGTVNLLLSKSRISTRPHNVGIGLWRHPFMRFHHLGKPPSFVHLAPSKCVRWMSSDGNAGGTKNNNTSAKPNEDSAKTATDQVTAPRTATAEVAGDAKPEQLDPRTFLLGTTARIRRVAEFQGQVGDEIATYAIVVLLSGIIIAPIMAQYMRRSDNNYDELDTDDQVVDMARIVKHDFLDKISEGSLEDKGVVHTVIADVLSSKSLQEQAIKFVVTIVQSEEVKSACQKLLKDLFTDLVKDPETTAQVIFLLNAAIQNEDIRLAVKQLVLEIVEDEEVLEELVRLLQKLGQDQEVLDATRTLLTESAHNALNDPDILDHSMEFATDVVGDDVVQRTAGEALRNTLSYAVQPGMSILLAATGVGLLFFSVMSLGYARSSEQDAKVLDQAVSGLARSLQPSPRITDRVWNFITLPFRAVSSAVGAAFTTVLLPYQLVQRAVAQIKYTTNAASKAATLTSTWFVENARTALAWILGGATAMNQYGNTAINFVVAPYYWFVGRNTEQSTCPTSVGWTDYLMERLGDHWRAMPHQTMARVWVSLDKVSETYRVWVVYFRSLVWDEGATRSK